MVFHGLALEREFKLAPMPEQNDQYHSVFRCSMREHLASDCSTVEKLVFGCFMAEKSMLDCTMVGNLHFDCPKVEKMAL